MHDTDFHLSYTIPVCTNITHLPKLSSQKKNSIKNCRGLPPAFSDKVGRFNNLFRGPNVYDFPSDVSKQMGLSVVHFNPL